MSIHSIPPIDLLYQNFYPKPQEKEKLLFFIKKEAKKASLLALMAGVTGFEPVPTVLESFFTPRIM